MKEMVEIVAPQKKNSEEKEYLVALMCKGNVPNDWEICIGRTEARQYIIDMAQHIDYEYSFVLVEEEQLVNRISVVKFMRHIEKFYEDNPFDIDDYIKGDWDEMEDFNSRTIDDTFNNTWTQLSGKELLEGNIVYRDKKEE